MVYFFLEHFVDLRIWIVKERGWKEIMPLFLHRKFHNHRIILASTCAAAKFAMAKIFGTNNVITPYNYTNLKTLPVLARTIKRAKFDLIREDATNILIGLASQSLPLLYFYCVRNNADFVRTFFKLFEQLQNFALVVYKKIHRLQ